MNYLASIKVNENDFETHDNLTDLTHPHDFTLQSKWSPQNKQRDTCKSYRWIRLTNLIAKCASLFFPDTHKIPQAFLCSPSTKLTTAKLYNLDAVTKHMRHLVSRSSGGWLPGSLRPWTIGWIQRFVYYSTQPIGGFSSLSLLKHKLISSYAVLDHVHVEVGQYPDSVSPFTSKVKIQG